MRSFLRVLPSAIAIIPVSMLFGALAHRAEWSIFEILAAGFLGFTGSGQFALLPLAETNTSFLTMLIICASTLLTVDTSPLLSPQPNDYQKDFSQEFLLPIRLAMKLTPLKSTVIRSKKLSTFD